MVHSVKGYVKIKEIGSGSFGKVSLVKNKDEKLFCMKTVDTARMSGKERKQAQNEVKVLSHLKHPYIITYRESFMDNFQLCIVMDYAEGGDLFKVIDRARRKCQSLGEPKILRWITQSLLALKYLHDKHVLHRDLKSQNIFLSSSGRIKLGDFGISKVLESTECFAKTSIGTPYYLAPEICSQKPYSWSADIWALGCILYELCMLRVPFDAQNFKQLCDRITRTKAPGISGSFSASLKEMCATMLSSQPRQRPSAADLLQRPIIQGEIRLMLEEEKQKKESQTEDVDVPDAAQAPAQPAQSAQPVQATPLAQENKPPAAPNVPGTPRKDPAVAMRNPATPRQYSPRQYAPRPPVRGVSPGPLYKGRPPSAPPRYVNYSPRVRTPQAGPRGLR
jgi:NIMA (never in mitosis gene a)-related kinase